MVKLHVHVRVISEDAFNEHLDSGRPIPAREERILKVIVREPSEWYVGALANEVKEKYRSNYKHDLGQIKYLKDNEDADLDTEYFVSDVLIDEGKAAQDGLDQQVTIKVIREQGRGVRMGSVVPDLTPLHYRPPSQNLPPVPKFNDLPSSLGKRKPEEIQQPQVNGLPLINGVGPAKRQRLGQIEEEDQHIHRSIEGPVDSSTQDVVIQDSQLSPAAERQMFNYATVKLESPQLGYEFSNIGPVSADELEYLPNGPTNLRQSSAVREHDITTRGAGLLSPNQQGRPITPVSDRQGRTMPRSTVSILNNMKSASPNPRRQGSASAKKFTRPGRDLFAPPESDIDDSQMSPNSRGAPRIQPTLVSTARDAEPAESTERTEVDGGTPRMGVTDLPLNQSKPAARAQILQNAKERMPAKVASDAISGAIEDRHNRSGEAPESSKTKRRRKRPGRVTGASQDESNPPSESRPITDSAITNETPLSGSKKQGKAVPRANKPLTPSPDRDSPGMQLSESLHRSTPAVKKVKSIQFEVTADTSNAEDAVDVSESSEDTETATAVKKTSPVLRVSKAAEPIRTTKTASEPKPHKTAELRCYSCWSKKSKCDNARPKCAACVKYTKTCQEYGLTREEAEKMKAEKARRKSSTPVPAPGKSKMPEEYKAGETKSTKMVKRGTEHATSPEMTTNKSVSNTQSAQAAKHAQPPRGSPVKPKKQESSEETAQHEHVICDKALAAPKSHATIPPWMSAEEYEATLKKNEGMTEEMRQLHKQSSRSALRRSVTYDSSEDDESPAPSKQVASKQKKAAEPKPSTKAQESKVKKTSAATASAESSPAPDSVKNSFVSINLPKPQTQTPRANGANAPFRSRNKKVAESVRPTLTNSSGASTPVLNQAKNLKDLMKVLAETRKLEAATSSTPTPTIVNRAAAGPWPSNKAAPGIANSSQKSVFNLDDEDESESESESESDESTKPTPTAVPRKRGPGQIVPARGKAQTKTPVVNADETSSDGDTETGSESD